jgi:hypothetical protein
MYINQILLIKKLCQGQKTQQKRNIENTLGYLWGNEYQGKIHHPNMKS